METDFSKVTDSRPEIISSGEAAQVGFKMYFTGKACRQGHVCYRFVSNGVCAICYRLQQNEWRRRNPEKVKQYELNRRRRDPEGYAARQLAASQKWKEVNREHSLLSMRIGARKRRKLNPEAQRQATARLRAKQDLKQELIAGRPRPLVCELCNEKPSGGPHKRICFDHCHVAGHFRGWLCDRCNKVLGLVNDSRDLLEKMEEYLGQADIKRTQSAA